MVKLVMRLVCTAVVGVTILSGRAAASATSPPPTVTVVPAPVKPVEASETASPRQPAVADKASKTSVDESSKRTRFLGATFDIGFPDGANIGVVGRPWNWLRLGVAAGTNSISPGVRGGIALIPFGVGPSVIVEGGRYFEGNASQTASSFAGSSSDSNGITKQFGYNYANLHLGLDLGQERFTFFLHGGMSYLHTVLNNANETFGGTSASSNGATTSVVINGRPTLTAWVPSLKFGFIFYVV